MKRLTTSIISAGLALGLAAGSASAQTYPSGGYYGQGYGQGGYAQPNVDRYGQDSGAYYDYARVVRVDPVIASGDSRYRTSDYSNCRTMPGTNSGSYAGNGGYYGNDAYRNDPYRNDGYSNQGYYGDQGYGNQGYGNQGNGSNAGRTVATVIGGVLGAAIGSQVGGGSARYATSAIGSMVGGMAGRQVYDNTHGPQGMVRVCDPQPVRGNDGYYGNAGNYYGTGNQGVSAYDVTYEYGGRTYTTRTNYNPGNRIRVRVDVRPE